MRHAPILGVLLLAALSSACSGSSAEGKCSTTDECNQGYVCVETTCTQVECTAHADCPGTDAFCAPPGVNPDDPEKKFCSPIKCSEKVPCPDGFICNQYKQCVAAGDATDVVEDVGDDEVTSETTETPEVKPVSGAQCKACSSDAECAGLKCLPLGGGTFCFGDCTSHAECPTGWMCYALGNQGQQCIPMAFKCEATCLKTGCPEGKVCNQETGECSDGKPSCGACQQDWDCAEGGKCFQASKYCAPACPADTCPQNSTCQEVNTLKVKLCVSSSPVCCYGSECGDACPPETPYSHNGKCVQCLEDSNCPQGQTCSADKACQSGKCQPPTPFEYQGTCVECLKNADCAAKGANYVCDLGQHKCVFSDKPAECGNCPPSYPACTQINGIWSCVQCTDDTYCPGSKCDMTLFACIGGPGCGSCTNDGQCISSMGTALKCDAPSGCCYDPAGWCDGVESMCNTAKGSECLGLMDALMGGMGGIPGMPGMPEGMAFGLCTCDEPMGIDGFLCLFMGGCPAGGCFGDAICIDPAAIPVLGDLVGQIAQGKGICLNPKSIMDLLGGGLPF